jgi:hypothetical protein
MAKILQSRTEIGGTKGDILVGGEYILGKVYSDGVYRFDAYVTPPSSVEDLTQDSSNAPTREVINNGQSQCWRCCSH